MNYPLFKVHIKKEEALLKIEKVFDSGFINEGETVNEFLSELKKYLGVKNLILVNPQLRLHLIGKLQSNKAEDAFEIFHYIHTLDNEKLAKIFAKLESISAKKIKYFIQVNIADEPQKNGICIDKVNQFVKYCAYDLKLNVVGLMCIPPLNSDSNQYFKKLAELAKINNLNELSMGMSNDYECAIKNGATFVRIGSKIFTDD